MNDHFQEPDAPEQREASEEEIRKAEENRPLTRQREASEEEIQEAESEDISRGEGVGTAQREATEEEIREAEKPSGQGSEEPA